MDGQTNYAQVYGWTNRIHGKVDGDADEQMDGQINREIDKMDVD